MEADKKCVRCGGTNLEPGTIQSTGRMYFRPANAKFLGLNLEDDPHLALFWNKESLGHNGQRMPDGGQRVSFIYAPEVEYVSGPEWLGFMEKQRELLAARGRKEKP